MLEITLFVWSQWIKLGKEISLQYKESISNTLLFTSGVTANKSATYGIFSILHRSYLLNTVQLLSIQGKAETLLVWMFIEVVASV